MDEKTSKSPKVNRTSIVASFVKSDDRACEIKTALNELLWTHARSEVTLVELEDAACKAFDALWGVCEGNRE